MKMVANETELRNALKEKAPEITIVTSYADTVKKKYGLDLKANVERLQTTVDSYDIEQIETSLTAAKGIQNFFEHIPL